MRRNRGLAGAGILAASLLFNATAFAAPRKTASPVVIAYVFPQNHVLQPGEIDARKVTRINYAFANIKDGRMVEGFPTDAANFAALNALKKLDPSLTVLVSVGGWLGSGHFSDMALTEQSRRTFIDSVIAFLEKYNLDGLDIDWEYPGQPGAGNRFRPEDRQNYTALLRELRERFTQEEKTLHRRLYLSVATGAESSFLQHTDMAQAQRYVDTVNLMTYDYSVPGGDNLTGLNAPLFPDPADPKHASADQSVRECEQAGVPASKIVLGIPFYGHEWGEVSDKDHGLFQPGKPGPNTFVDYANLAANLPHGATPEQGFARYWDLAAAVPYLYNAKTHIFVSYDDPQSVSLKCRYALTHHLAGVMFWTYESDADGTLLHAVDAALLQGKK